MFYISTTSRECQLILVILDLPPALSSHGDQFWGMTSLGVILTSPCEGGWLVVLMFLRRPLPQPYPKLHCKAGGSVEGPLGINLNMRYIRINAEAIWRGEIQECVAAVAGKRQIIGCVG